MSFLRRSNLKHVNKHNPFLSSIAQNLFHTFPSSNYQLYLFLVHCWENCRLELCILCANWMISHLLSFFTWFIHAAWIARACLLYEKKTWAERQTIRPDLFHSSTHQSIADDFMSITTYSLVHLSQMTNFTHCEAHFINQMLQSLGANIVSFWCNVVSYHSNMHCYLLLLKY